MNDHGTQQGIVPRFILQMLELEEQMYMPIGGSRKSYRYITVASADFTSFFDLHQSIKENRREYTEKLLSKELIEIQENGTLEIDRSLEIALIQSVKDFFIRGRIILNNWAKSNVIKDDFFDINNLLFVKDSNFINQKERYLSSDEDMRYEYLFKLIEDGRNLFLSRFINIRVKIEHADLRINYSQIELIDGEIKISEPLLDNSPLYELIDFFYENIFNLIEKVMVYFFGINAFINWNGEKSLFKREEFDFEKQLYEFVILQNQVRDRMMKLIS